MLGWRQKDLKFKSILDKASEILPQKQNKIKKAWSMAQVVLPSKWEALGSIPSTRKERKRNTMLLQHSGSHTINKFIVFCIYKQPLEGP
jgi:hypothetical protein